MNRNAALAVVAFVGVLYALSALVALAVGFVGGGGGEAPAERPAVLLVSIDGFRHDYLGRHPAPTLERLAAEGARAERLVPAYPSVTFPNHTTLVTGLRPARHGIVGNRFFDPARGEVFSAGDAAQQADPHWWRGEPIWAAVEREGRRAMVLSWPGAEAPSGGVRPSRWHRFDGGMRYGARVDTVAAWLSLPDGARPAFATLYFEGVDDAGHRFGPDAPETAAAVAAVDRALARLFRRLGDRADRVDVVVVSDHGMAAMATDRVVFVDEALGAEAWARLRADLRHAFWDEPAQLWPEPGREAAVVAALRGADLGPVRVVRRDEAPAALHVRGADRVAPVLLVAPPGWAVTPKGAFRNAGRAVWGSHGFDPRAPEMGGLLVARGPSFRAGARVGPVENVHVYPLLAEILGVDSAAHDGDLREVSPLLRR